MRGTPASIDVWLSYGCETRYSISLCREDGEEFTCLEGAPYPKQREGAPYPKLMAVAAW